MSKQNENLESLPEGQRYVGPVDDGETLQPFNKSQLANENPSNVSVPEESIATPIPPKDSSGTWALLEAAYQSRGRKLSLKKTDFENLSISRSRWSEDVEVIERLTKTDTLLVLPHKFLAAMVQAEVVGSVREHLMNLMREAVIRHPAYRSRIIQEQLSSDQVTPNSKKIKESLSQIRTSEAGTGDEKMYKPIEVNKVAINFLSYLALDQLLRSKWTVERYIDEMFACVWSSKSLGHFATGAELGLAKDHVPLGLLAANYSQRMQLQSQELQTARRMGQHQASRASEAEVERDSGLVEILKLETDLIAKHEETSRLETLLALERDAHSADQLHHANDNELMRTRLLRQLKTQSELLSDGSHALGSGSLKTANEFMDRAKEAIDQEIEHLKSMGGFNQ